MRKRKQFDFDIGAMNVFWEVDGKIFGVKFKANQLDIIRELSFGRLSQVRDMIKVLGKDLSYNFYIRIDTV